MVKKLIRRRGDSSVRARRDVRDNVSGPHRPRTFALVRSFFVVMRFELNQGTPERGFSKENRLRQTFLLGRFYPAFREETTGQSEGSEMWGTREVPGATAMTIDTKKFTTARGALTTDRLLRLMFGRTKYLRTAVDPRPDLREVDTEARRFVQEGLVPKTLETHGGEDVVIYAKGPGSHLFRGTREQNYIFMRFSRPLDYHEQGASGK